MRCITVVLVLAAGILLMQGCKKAEEPAEPAEAKVHAPKAIEQLEVDWDELADRVRSHSELQEQLDAFIKKHTQSQETGSTKEALKWAYRMLTDPGAKAGAPKDALELCIKLDAKEVIRQGLLHNSWDIVITAARALANQADRGVKDRDALPYLIYVLGEMHDLPGGSDLMAAEERVILGIQKITDLDVKTGEIDVESTKEVDRFLSLARDWAKANGVKLLD